MHFNVAEKIIEPQQAISNQSSAICASQSPEIVLMVRPHHFTPNPQTQNDNSFQVKGCIQSGKVIAKRAFVEVTEAVRLLRSEGVEVLLFEDESRDTPDSVFPNNWFSTHASGEVVTYPMYAENRRLERRDDILNYLQHNFHVVETKSFAETEQSQLFLEGTGAMVLDHQNRIVYAARSLRMSSHVLAKWCREFNFTSVEFDATDSDGKAIYHTNVMMSVATHFVVICLDAITDLAQKKTLLDAIAKTGKTVIAISMQQMNSFCGNVLELNTVNGPILTMSSTAFAAFNPTQLSLISRYAKPIAINVETIEQAGGSIRCMLAGIHLEKVIPIINNK